jgi:hypothetical protein
MSDKSSHVSLIGRRGELLAELFLQDLNPEFVAQTTKDIGYDFLVGFPNSKGGINNFLVEVKATEHIGRRHYQIPRRLYDRAARSNTPVLLLVVDVKENRLYYAWLKEKEDDVSKPHGTEVVRIELTEIDNSTKEDLRRQLAT